MSTCAGCGSPLATEVDGWTCCRGCGFAYRDEMASALTAAQLASLLMVFPLPGDVRISWGTTVVSDWLSEYRRMRDDSLATRRRPPPLRGEALREVQRRGARHAAYLRRRFAPGRTFSNR